MKNAIILLVFLFSLVFAAPDGKPLSYVERRNKLNKDINDCIVKGGVSDLLKNNLTGNPHEDIRNIVKSFLKDLTDTDKKVIMECRKKALKTYYDAEKNK